jgi:hypothetical protein
MVSGDGHTEETGFKKLISFIVKLHLQEIIAIFPDVNKVKIRKPGFKQLQFLICNISARNLLCAYSCGLLCAYSCGLLCAYSGGLLCAYSGGFMKL